METTGFVLVQYKNAQQLSIQYMGSQGPILCNSFTPKSTFIVRLPVCHGKQLGLEELG